MWYLMYRTRFGLRMRACGENPQALDAAGQSVAKHRFISVLISGALSGIGGMFFAYSIAGNFSASIFVGYGYLAVASWIFGNYNIGGTLAVCLFFGLVRAGGFQFCVSMGLSSNYSYLFQAIPYVLTVIPVSYTHLDVYKRQDVFRSISLKFIIDLVFQACPEVHGDGSDLNFYFGIDRSV